MVELQGVMEAAASIDYPWGPMTTLLVLSGQLLEEIANATWDEFNLDRDEWAPSGERTKNGRPHIVHLSDVALAVIRELPAVEGQR